MTKQSDDNKEIKEATPIAQVWMPDVLDNGMLSVIAGFFIVFDDIVIRNVQPAQFECIYDPDKPGGNLEEIGSHCMN